jgi:hypothetical protein
VIIFALVVILLNVIGGDDDDDDVDSMGVNVVTVSQHLQLPPPNGCTRNGEPIDCLDRWSSGPFSRESSEKLQKYSGAVLIGCAGGFAAASGPGAAYGCTAAALAAVWDWGFSN